MTKGEPENMGGIVVYLSSGSSKQEFARVGFIRRATKNPKVSFDAMLDLRDG
jgi:hypothetical protein